MPVGLRENVLLCISSTSGLVIIQFPQMAQIEAYTLFTKLLFYIFKSGLPARVFITTAGNAGHEQQ